MGLDIFGDDELHSDQADAVVRQKLCLESQFRIAQIQHDLGFGRCIRDKSVCSTRIQPSGVNLADITPAQLTSPGRRPLSHRSYLRSRSRPEPHSRAMMRGVRPPRLVTMAAAVFMTGSQSGVVMSATSTAGLEGRQVGDTGNHRALPTAILLPTARPLVMISPACLSSYCSNTVPVVARPRFPAAPARCTNGRPDHPWPIPCPLAYHMVFDFYRIIGQGQHVGIV